MAGQVAYVVLAQLRAKGLQLAQLALYGAADENNDALTSILVGAVL